MNILRAAFLLAFIGQSVNATDEIEVFSLSTDIPTVFAGNGFQLPQNIEELLGIKYITRSSTNEVNRVYVGNRIDFTSEQFKPLGLNITSFPDYLEIGAANMNYRQILDKNYIFAKIVPRNYFSIADNIQREQQKGADVLAIIKKIILEDAFQTFKKAHLALNLHDIMAMINDVNREIKNILIAQPVKAIRTINNFSQIVEGINIKHGTIYVGFKQPNILVLTAKDDKGIAHFLIIKLTPQAINEIVTKAKEAANQ